MKEGNIRDHKALELEREEINQQMSKIKYKIMILSGKGGVGKSTVAVNLALGLAASGKKVGLLDIDIHGPSVPKLLGMEESGFETDGQKILPIRFNENLFVMSIAFFLQKEDSAVIWRGPLKMGVIKQFLKDVNWGELDYLVVDSPPGTGDEPLSICQLIQDAAGSIIVTTPQELSIIDVKKCISFCRTVNTKVLGVIENMSGLICPHCNKEIELFGKHGGENMAKEMGVDFLGSIPIVPEVVSDCDKGIRNILDYKKTEMAKIFDGIVKTVLQKVEGNAQSSDISKNENLSKMKNKENDMEVKIMRIAIPITDGKLSPHFGHSQHFAIIEVDENEKKVLAEEFIDSPPHQPGLLPNWLAEKKVNVIITGGMGKRAQDLFDQKNIKVVVGAKQDVPQKIVAEYMKGTLLLEENPCDH